MQAFSMVMFLLLGVALTAFVLLNPLGLPFLPQRDRGQDAPAQPAADRQLFQCPMDPEVIEEQPGSCPKCGMPLVPMKEQLPDHAEHPVGTDAREREILYWYAPMDPTYIRDEPGLSPMGMKLVPKYADEGRGAETGVIKIDPVQVQNIGVKSEPARLGDVALTARTVGILDFNADLITWVNTKFSGWIEKVHVNYVGQDVREGQALFEVYSPELVTTQEEYVRAMDYKDSLDGSDRTEARRQAESLLRSTRDRLAYWDISEEQIRALTESRRVQRRLTVLSPVDGVVVEVMDEALEGMFIRPGMDLYKIADISSLWVHADVYESDLPWIREKQPARVYFRSDPDQVFRGKILFLYPEVSRETRTLKICVEVPNKDARLRAGMYADVVLQGPPVRDAVLIPNSAVLRSGERDLVFIDLGEGRFAPREVTLGIRGEGDVIQILEGLAPGEAVVTQSQFMLDSESRVQEAIAKFVSRRDGESKPAEKPSPPASGGHRHGE
jgi:Cu(I)/Ag(I) efflux system membrane fusion protein/cobalt-zinc-cadmium efflux system membrane fusion protein